MPSARKGTHPEALNSSSVLSLEARAKGTDKPCVHVTGRVEDGLVKVVVIGKPVSR